MNKSNLYILSFVAKCIQFEKKAITECKVTANVMFLEFSQQMLFEPVILPTTGTLNLNGGKNFAFGISRDMELNLAKEFVIRVNLEQVDFGKYLSEAQIDITTMYQRMVNNCCQSNVNNQVSQ